MPACPSHPSAQAETANVVAASSTTDVSVYFPLKVPLSKQEFVGVGGEHHSVRLAGHNFGVDVSVGSVVQNCEQMFVDQSISVGSEGRECAADEFFLWEDKNAGSDVKRVNLAE